MENFLPKEQVDPEHVLVSFNSISYKRVMDFSANFMADILASGFFTSHDPATCKLICKTKKKFDSLKKEG